MNTSKSCFDAASRKRLYWHSRRGMLELDLLLVPFAENCLAGLDDASIGLYQDLLAEEDQDLFLWLTRRAEAPTPELQHIVDIVLGKRL
jgi:antitoxin CptB